MRKTLLFLMLCFCSLHLLASGNAFGVEQAIFDDPPSYHWTSDKPTFSVYPNPAIDYINIEDRSKVIREVVIYNLVGRKIKSFKRSANDRYDVSDLQKGLYLVQMIGDAGEIFTTQRINKK